MRAVLFVALLATIAGSLEPRSVSAGEPFDPDTFFSVRNTSGSVPISGKDEASVSRVVSSVRWVLERAETRVAEGLERQGASLYIIDNEEELERNPALLEYLLESGPLELIYTNIEGIDETRTDHRGTVAQKLMQLFVYYPLERDPDYSDLKAELEGAFEGAIEPNDEIEGQPLYDANDYSRPDEAHPHMGPPYYTALGAYLGLGYEVRFGLSQPDRGETEYYPITTEEVSRLDPALVAFLDKHMNKVHEEAIP
jgi:hypothetical protein